MIRLLKNRTIASWLTLILALIEVEPSQALDWSTTDDFPYTMTLAAELSIVPGGAALLGVGTYLKATMDAPNEAEILALDRSDVSAFDRSATHNFNDLADDLSDVGRAVTGASPAWLVLPELWDFKKRWMNIVTLVVMYGETSMWTMGTVQLTKALVKRPRPYMYNEQVPMETKLETRYTSFFSGHTSFAFCGAVFLSTVFADLYPESPWRFAVWGGSVAAAGLTGYMRYVAGDHFATDIIVGATVGSLLGYIVPFLHRKSLWNNGEAKVAIVPATSRHRAGLDIIWVL
jgi:membrane-associated phospholipid phosphatase